MRNGYDRLGIAPVTPDHKMYSSMWPRGNSNLGNMVPAGTNPFNNFQAGGSAGYRATGSFANLGVGQRENQKYLNSPISHANLNQDLSKSPRGGNNQPPGQAYNPMVNAPMSISGAPVMNPFGSQ